MTNKYVVVPPMTDESGKEYISHLNSFLFWRLETDYFNKDAIKALRGNDQSCKFCGAALFFDSEEVGKIYCICVVDDKIRRTRMDYAKLRSPSTKAKLSQLEIWGTSKEQQSLASARDQAIRFIHDPRKWLVLLGLYGCGKTHMMKAIARAYGSYAVYMTSSDFEQVLYESMDNNNLSSTMWKISRAPILLIDDLGAEHGTDLGFAKLRQIIDFRYGLWPEFPLVISSNLNRNGLRKLDPRIASRLLHDEKSVTRVIKNSDYRARPL
jgi:DNA replication protein DnaC